MNTLISVISILVAVAFYTILERKILGYIQIRKGPNKVGMSGILQPFADAIKLFNKSLSSNDSTNFILSWGTPTMSIILALMIIPIIPFNSLPSLDMKQNILALFIISSFSVYSIMLVGWSSNSKYAHLGALRSIAQMISYEVSFFLIILFITLMSSSYFFPEISLSQKFLTFFLGNLLIFTLWMTSCLAEVNRSPFDFAEGESELVSGFNVEYMGGWFALIFLGEYMNMIILSMVTTILFFMKMGFPFFMMIIFVTSLMLWVRGAFPRFRYDLLMTLSWKIFLPTILFLIPLPLLVSLLAV